MANLTATGTDDNIVQRPTDDVPIKPRSMTRMLTDEGVVDAHVDAEPVGESPVVEASDEAVDPLDALLNEADAAEAAKVEAPSSDEPTAPNFDAPEMQAFNDQFKQLMGIDLKQAFEQYTSLSERFEQQQATIVEQTAQASVRSLQEKWGVNEAEFNTRVEKVLAYTAKLPEATRTQFDSVDGIDRIWSRLSTERSAPPPNSGGRPSGGSAGADGKTFRKSELQKMMVENPKLYSSMQAAIRNAYENGGIIDDI